MATKRKPSECMGINKFICEYDSKKEWRADPKGYFLIKLFPKEKEIGVLHMTNRHKPTAEFRGKNALEIYQTIIKKKLLSSLSHAAYLGKELTKAEIALKSGKKYTQS